MQHRDDGAAFAVPFRYQIEQRGGGRCIHRREWFVQEDERWVLHHQAGEQRALQLTQTACKAKALTSSAELEKTIASERHSMENLDRAREKAAEMYATSFTLCMLSSGYVKK